MNKDQYKNVLYELRGTRHGLALSSFLADQVAELKDVTKVNSWEETLGKQIAIKSLEELFSFLKDKEVTQKKKGGYM